MDGGQPGEMGGLGAVASERMVRGDHRHGERGRGIVGALFLVAVVVSSAGARAGTLRGVRGGGLTRWG